jgi:transposase
LPWRGCKEARTLVDPKSDMPATVRSVLEEDIVAVVMIGVDPHKGSHTALALDPDEVKLGQIRVRASSTQVESLLSWSANWPDRIWAIEGATGLGRLLAQQLLSAGEQVLDVQPKLAARVRLLTPVR